jgi:hypothetical protein
MSWNRCIHAGEKLHLKCLVNNAVCFLRGGKKPLNWHGELKSKNIYG